MTSSGLFTRPSNLIVQRKGYYRCALSKMVCRIRAGIFLKVLLNLLAALHPASPTTVIGYEEPENGIHPTRLKLVADLFKNTQELYNKQIIVNTHSPIFPTFFEDRSLFVCRKKGANSQIVSFNSAGAIFRRGDISRHIQSA